MKKNIFVILLSSFLLAGCEFNLSFIKLGNSESKEPGMEQNHEENNQNSQENTGENENNNEPQGGEQGENQQQDPPINEYVATILTSGSEFASQFSDRTQFGNESGTQNLKNFLAGKLNNSNLLTSLECSTMQALNFKDSRILQIGSGSATGSFVWESANTKIYKVEATVCCYTKYNDYDNIWVTDSWSHFLIDQDDHDLTYDGAAEPEMVSFSKTYENGTNSFALSNKDGRVFVKEMKITWRL